MNIKQLWAPWRMEYLGDVRANEVKGCVFCELPKQSEDRNNLIVHRGKTQFVILNRFPYNSGHVMVVPNQHTNDLGKLSSDEMQEMMQLIRRSTEALKHAYKAEGFNIGMNLGTAGGAGIRDHLHMHIVPRWVGDTNFMPIIAEAKAMPQHLLTSYDQILEGFRRTTS